MNNKLKKAVEKREFGYLSTDIYGNAFMPCTFFFVFAGALWSTEWNSYIQAFLILGMVLSIVYIAFDILKTIMTVKGLNINEVDAEYLRYKDDMYKVKTDNNEFVNYFIEELPEYGKCKLVDYNDKSGYNQRYIMVNNKVIRIDKKGTYKWA